MNKLDQMRAQVRSIDREIIKLIAERNKTTRLIGEHKKKSGIPLRNWEVEKQVIDNAQTIAKNYNLSTTMIRSVMQQLIADSRVQQEKMHYSVSLGKKEKFLIIGGKGQMGKWFGDFLSNQGQDVVVFDKKSGSSDFPVCKELRPGLEGVNYTVIATPLNSIPDVLAELSEIKPAGTIFDIASLKGFLKPALDHARRQGLSVTSIHPMFGPNARTLSDKVICLCDCGDEIANRRVHKLFLNTAASIVELSLEEHDRLISYVLGLSHFINIFFMSVLRRSGQSYRRFQQVASTTFLNQMKTAASVIDEKPDLYYTIQKLNPYGEELYQCMEQVLQKLIYVVREGKQDDFIEIMKRSREWLKP
ncbi:hypothetical protein A2Y85_03480 [candidate division WOR-3 bacterium RBG_13_43_14]|uniref:Chorismate mutase n=1 Tax=candidate division WOR-3 bacterium RBG_13_43_14 TaxID=1802590 RepID=A0A1F4UAD5_UNCW3|nr:MAG: hypothetical protein A2Y85_03480 [candidate division WOR-3 bacterium RBG_13_43_14]